jgi:hypothetical protein
MKTGNRRRLLIVDGHSSHVNLKFLEFADSKRILVMILPPHSTRRLQLLDVGLFSPLARAYTNRINKITHRSLGMTSMSKRLFWGVFREPYSKSFYACQHHISFRKTRNLALRSYNDRSCPAASKNASEGTRSTSTDAKNLSRNQKSPNGSQRCPTAPRSPSAHTNQRKVVGRKCYR